MRLLRERPPHGAGDNLGRAVFNESGGLRARGHFDGVPMVCPGCGQVASNNGSCTCTILSETMAKATALLHASITGWRLVESDPPTRDREVLVADPGHLAVVASRREDGWWVHEVTGLTPSPWVPTWWREFPVGPPIR